MPLIFKVLTGLILASLATSCWWSGKLDKGQEISEGKFFQKNNEFVS
jgi:hypothetical protein